MARIGVLGAGGVLGRLVVDAAQANGAEVVPAAHDPAEAGSVLGVPAAAVRRVDARDAAAVAALCDAVDAVVVATPGVGELTVEAAVRAACHHLDASLHPQHVTAVLDRWHEPAGAAGVSVLPAAGLLCTVGDLLAARALREVPAPRQVHVAYALSGPGGPVRPTSVAVRLEVADLLASYGSALVDGRVRRERPGEARRLAWFPRPLGMRHAAGIPGAEPLTVPRHTTGVTTARTYLALRTVATELLQAAATVTRWAPAGRLVRAALVGGSDQPLPAARAATRWACVAEAVPATGAPPGRHDVVRAWASGRDPYATAAAVLARLATAAATGELRCGAQPVAAAGDAAGWLDELAQVAGMRWSVA